MKRLGWSAVPSLMVLPLILATFLGACTTGPKPIVHSKPAIVPLVRIVPAWSPQAKTSFCIWFSFTVTAKGAVADEQVVAGLREGNADISRYEQEAASALANSAFFPRKEGWKPIATPNVIQAYLNDAATTRKTEGAVTWTCNQPLLVTSRPILVFLPAATAGLTTMATSHEPLSATTLSSTNGPASATQFAVRIEHMPRSLSDGQGNAAIKVQFCIDPTGHVADAIMSDGSRAEQAIALAALNAVPFTPRGENSPPVQGLLIGAPEASAARYRPLLFLAPIRTKGFLLDRSRALPPPSKPIWSCGLVTRVHVLPNPVNGVIATIERASFKSLNTQAPTNQPIPTSSSGAK